MTFHGKVPKIVWRTTTDYLSEGFESPPYKSSAHADGIALTDAWTPVFNADIGLDVAYNRFGLSGEFPLSGQFRLSTTYLGVPDVVGGWNNYVERVFGGYLPGEKVLVTCMLNFYFSIYSYGFNTTPVGIRVNGAQDLRFPTNFGFDTTWLKLSVRAIADASGNLTVQLGTFGGFNLPDNFSTQRILAWDNLNLPAPSVTTPDNALNIGYPPLNARSWSQPDPGSVNTRYDSGLEDAWVLRNDRLLSLDIYGIPAVDEVTSYGPSSGWDQWRQFLEAARTGQVFDFYPDKDQPDFVSCVLSDPKSGPPANGWNQTRSLTLVLRRLDDLRWEGY